MKKFFSIVLMAFFAMSMSVAANAGQKIDPSQVPNSLRVFVADNFGDKVTIAKAERDAKYGGYEYDVTLSNGVEIDYGVSEEWLEIDAEKSKASVPPQIVGDAIMNHLTVTYPGKNVKKIERKYAGFELTLDNGLDLLYDKNGRFVMVDD